MKIREQLSKLACEITEIRRDLHMHPEIGFEEERTYRLLLNSLPLQVLKFTVALVKRVL